MKEKEQSEYSIVMTEIKSEKCKVEFHSRHHKLVIRDLKTGKYVKKPNKH